MSNVRIADLKARLSEHLRFVRNGGTVSEPMPVPLGTLDAIHLATALLSRDRIGPLPQLVTHNAPLGAAARGFGFDVRGI